MTATLRPLARLLIESTVAASGPLPEGLDEVAAEEVIAAGELHRVTPAIRRRVARSEAPPTAWMPVLNRARQAQLFRHVQAAADLRTAGGALAGLRWAVSKGPILADLVWPHVDMREYTDIDLYVHPADFGAALGALEAVGFHLVDRNWPEIRRLCRSELALRGPSGLALDLHWGLTGDPRRRREQVVSLPDILARSRAVTLGSGVEVQTFDPDDLVLHLALHAAQSGANKLMWLADIRHAVRRFGVDGTEVATRAQAFGVLAPVALVLTRVERAFGEDFALPPTLRRAGSDSAWAKMAARADGVSPFPGLPGDGALGGLYYSSARTSMIGSAARAAHYAASVRLIESRVRRRGVEGNPLDTDVPNPQDRRAYLRTVTEAG